MSRYPREWQTTTLAEICNPDSGLQTGPFGSQLHASDYSEQGVPVVMPKDIINYRVSIEDIARIPDTKADELSRHRLWIGDIVFARRGDIGRCALITSDEAGWICGTGCLRARLYTESVLPDYLIYYLDMEETKSWLEANAVGQTMLNLNTGILAELPILLPPLTEQRQIAAILSTWDEAITLTEQLIEALQRRKQALMQLLLTGTVRFPAFDGEWEEDVLGNVSVFLDERRKPIKESDRAKIQGSYPYYGASGIIDFVDDYIFDEDLILLGEDGENILSRNVPLAFMISGKTWVNNHAHVIRPNPNMDIRFLTAFLENLDYKPYNSGTAQPKLTKGVCLNIRVVVPSFEEQTAIGDFVEYLEMEINLLSNYSEFLRLQKRGLMQQLLTGAVRVQVEE
ncbi:MAG: restriction endonuclease subunit S [Anaerolineae bacterium]|nr:restriction endonuclease subunit S [Anaerolineae bacterium]